ncbi:hypothetical protein BJ138DRAFT_1014903, partial [Hygrophoropsis aurantiaca]
MRFEVGLNTCRCCSCHRTTSPPIAHRHMTEKLGTLHGDISAGNILITQDGRGVLTDWDERTDDKKVARRGTWLFMSACILQDQSKIHDIQDDMESFIHVLIYVAL